MGLIKPILLQSHTRALTKVIYNREGDLIFSAAKDNNPSVWFSENGERLGSFNGHSGSVWSLSVSSDSKWLASGSADNSMRIWDVETGKEKWKLSTETSVRWIDTSFGDGMIALVTDATMGKAPLLMVVDIKSNEIIRKIVIEDGTKRKATVVGWSDYNDSLVTGHYDGSLTRWDFVTSKIIQENTNTHTDAIRDLQFSPGLERGFFITASKDTTAKIFETESLTCIKTFKTERPVNSASISPLRAEVLIAGGQEALQVTTTSSRAGQFEARFYHAVFENELGRVNGHFGPINTLVYQPNGKGYASGAEDGYIRVHHFDDEYFDFNPENGLALEEPIIY